MKFDPMTFDIGQTVQIINKQTHGQTHRNMDRTDSITSTTDAGGKKISNDPDFKVEVHNFQLFGVV